MDGLQSVATTTQIVVNPFQGVLNLLNIIGMWKILEDRGEAGWKTLIPFWSTVVFGRTFGEEKLAKKTVFVSIGALLFAILTMLFATQKLEIPTLISFVLMIVLFIYAIILSVKLYSRFCKANNAQSWWVLVWVLASGIAAIYFAFIHKNYNIPGVTNKE